MKTINFKPFRFFLYCLFLSIGISACSKDDETEPEIDAENVLEYNGQSFSLNYGGLGKLGYDGTHTNYNFHVFKINSETDDIIPVYLFLDLHSPNEDGFKGGTFQYLGDEADVEGKSYIGSAFLIRNMSLANENAEEIVYVNEGNVKVSGSGDEFELEFDLKTDNDKTIKGSYGGTFESTGDPGAAIQNRTLNLIEKQNIKKMK